MSHPALEIQAALIAAFRADAALADLLGAGAVEDGPRRAAAFPHVSTGDFASRPIAADGWDGREHRLEFLVHSRAGGRAEALALMERLRAVAEGTEIMPAGHRLVGLALAQDRITRTRDGRGWRGALVFRAVTEPA